MPGIIKLSLAHQTMFADLSARCLDASFEADFPENGSFVRMESRGRFYWYYSSYSPAASGSKGVRRKLYIGPVDDPATASRVEAFGSIKTGYRERRQMVQSLAAAGLPSPAGFVGDVVELLWKAGLFRLRGVLVGTLAFQAYAGLLGVRMPGSSLMTGDADFAQFHSVSSAVGDAIPPIMELLQERDPSFRAVPHTADRLAATKFRNSVGFEVEFLTPNRGSDDHQGKPAAMPALGGASAEPLRFLDFLIRFPVRSVLLHKAGVPVTVPAPERYGVHKLIVATRRKRDADGRRKAAKDLLQAGMLIDALVLEGRSIDAGLAWTEAWARGPTWRNALAKGCALLEPRTAEVLRRAVVQACLEEGTDPATAGAFPPTGALSQT